MDAVYFFELADGAPSPPFAPPFHYALMLPTHKLRHQAVNRSPHDPLVG